MNYRLKKLKTLEFINTQINYDVDVEFELESVLLATGVGSLITGNSANLVLDTEFYFEKGLDILDDFTENLYLHGTAEGKLITSNTAESTLLQEFYFEKGLDILDDFTENLYLQGTAEGKLITSDTAELTLLQEFYFEKGLDILDDFSENLYLQGIAEGKLITSDTAELTLLQEFYFEKGLDILDDFAENLYLQGIAEGKLITGNTSINEMYYTIYMPSDQSQDEVITADDLESSIQGTAEGKLITGANAELTLETGIYLEGGLDILDDFAENLYLQGIAEGKLVIGDNATLPLETGIYFDGGLDILDDFAENLYLQGIAEGKLIISNSAESTLETDIYFDGGLAIIDDYELNLTLNNIAEGKLVIGDNAALTLEAKPILDIWMSQDASITIDTNINIISQANGKLVKGDSAVNLITPTINMSVTSTNQQPKTAMPTIGKRIASNNDVEVRFFNIDSNYATIYYYKTGGQTQTVGVASQTWSSWINMGCKDGSCPTNINAYAIAIGKTQSNTIWRNLNEPRLRWAYYSQSPMSLCALPGYPMIGTECTTENATQVIGGFDDGFSGCIVIKCIKV